MERSTLDLWVGLFVVAGIGALVILALKVGNMGNFGGVEAAPIALHGRPYSLTLTLPPLSVLFFKSES